MSTISPIRNIIFDLGGVILNIDYQKTSNAFASLGLTNFDELYTQAKQSGLFDEYEIGAISEGTFVQEIQRIIDAGIEKEAIINAWNAMLLDFPKHRLEYIEKLGTNYRLFLLSNTNQTHQRAFEQILLETINVTSLNPWFEKVYFSHILGKRKPNSDVFEHLLQENDLKAFETLFIDDSVQHVEGAKKVGIQAVLLENEDMVSLLDRYL